MSIPELVIREIRARPVVAPLPRPIRTASGKRGQALPVPFCFFSPRQRSREDSRLINRLAHPYSFVVSGGLVPRRELPDSPTGIRSDN